MDATVKTQLYDEMDWRSAEESNQSGKDEEPYDVAPESPE